jgi:glycosyltransferase involved in cell wall biosynthesis
VQHVAFLSFANFLNVGGSLTSSLASARYRVISPAKHLAARGFKVSIGTMPKVSELERIASLEKKPVVFSKSVNVENEILVEKLKKLGCRIILDLCDNYFDHSGHGRKYRSHTIKMCRLADKVVSSTDFLASVIYAETGVEAVVIPDPVEGPRGAARAVGGFDVIKLLWFGHPSNFPSVVSTIPSLQALSSDFQISLNIVTSPLPAVAQMVHRFAHSGDRLSCSLTEWSPDAVWLALESCDAVILPSSDSPFYLAKSSNRLIEAIWAGRCVVASPLPSYLPFSEFAYLGDNIADMLRKAISCGASDNLSRISAGQQIIENDFALPAVGRLWEHVIFS